MFGCAVGMSMHAHYGPNVDIWVPNTVRFTFFVLLLAEMLGIVEEMFENE